jgi:hypothetical protein
VSGRILIDFHGYNKHCEDGSQDNLSGNAAAPNKKKGSAHLEALTKEQQNANKDAMLARDQDLIFVTPLLEGFALKNKAWSECFPFISFPIKIVTLQS